MTTCRTVLTCLLVAGATLALPGCESKPPCKPAELAAAWNEAPLAEVVPTGESTTTCELPASEGETHAQFWRPVTVHRANMDAVGAAQDAGWVRNDDNWYGTEGNYNTPKWSELSKPEGKLRIEVEEVGGGAQIDLKFTPAG